MRESAKQPQQPERSAIASAAGPGGTSAFSRCNSVMRNRRCEGGDLQMARRRLREGQPTSFRKELIIFVERLELEVGTKNHETAFFAGPDHFHEPTVLGGSGRDNQHIHLFVVQNLPHILTGP